MFRLRLFVSSRKYGLTVDTEKRTGLLDPFARCDWPVGGMKEAFLALFGVVTGEEKRLLPPGGNTFCSTERNSRVCLIACHC